MNFEEFLNSLKVNAKEKFTEMYNTRGESAHELAKIRFTMPATFEYSLNYSLDIIKEYHHWLTTNYELIPKK